MLDFRAFVSATYELEGDRLELLLLHRKIERLRAWGRLLRANAEGVLPNVDSLLRNRVPLTVGLRIKKVCAPLCTPFLYCGCSVC